MCTGTWVGELIPAMGLTSIAEERYPIAVVLEERNGVVAGSAGPDVLAIAADRVASGTCDATTGQLRIEFDSSPGDVGDADERVTLDGVVRGDELTGTFTYGSSGRGRFRLARSP